MDGEVKNALRAGSREAQYDYEAKRLLGNKYILAYILIHTVDEFRGMKPKDVIPLIEGEPCIGSVPLEPGLTNEDKDRVVGLNTEYGEIHEGMVRFDIVFYVRTRDGLSQIIINVEAQKDAPWEYAILNRAIFYVCRLISSQKERDFTNTKYDDIKRVYSIWICMNQPQDSISYVHLTQDSLLGNVSWPGKLDLINIVLVGLSRELPGKDTEYVLHRLLGALFSDEMSVEEKLEIIEDEYDIPTTKDFHEGVNVMCNLGQGVLEKGLERGRREGRKEGREEHAIETVLAMYENNFTLEQIVKVTKKSLSEVQSIIEQKWRG